MIVLALDTATNRPSVALGAPGESLPEAFIADRNELSRRLAAVVKDLCDRRGVSPRSVDAVVVADGPGSFTGIRIGVAFAKGFHDALGVPLYAAPSLLGAASAACPGAGTVAVDYEAQRGDVYRAVYRFGDRSGAVARGPIDVVQPPVVMAKGSPVAAGLIRADERQASAAALLALLGHADGPRRITLPAGWQPVYGRPAEAEARRLARDASTRN